ncbi:hypothetical protein PoB_006047600 [Plakobranchus ocellatus]|uniref:Uncharacterized protein n=1 Tax=Plakobranchus ocellatus TaxID=259542 RepID=A0AAV4CQ16_9GAST|nr:hypothetical protein PoB_006047600 [Plakobranchus ocellatus]
MCSVQPFPLQTTPPSSEVLPLIALAPCVQRVRGDQSHSSSNDSHMPVMICFPVVRAAGTRTTVRTATRSTWPGLSRCIQTQAESCTLLNLSPQPHSEIEIVRWAQYWMGEGNANWKGACSIKPWTKWTE